MISRAKKTAWVFPAIVGALAMLFVTLEISSIWRKGSFVREEIKIGMSAGEVVQILSLNPYLGRGSGLYHSYELQSLTAAESSQCGALRPIYEECEKTTPAECDSKFPTFKADAGGCTVFIGLPINEFPQALEATMKATGRAEIWKAEIHAKFVILFKTDYTFLVSFGPDGKVASVSPGSVVAD